MLLRDLERYLKEHGFVDAGSRGGHRYWSDGALKLTLPGHGPKEVNPRVLGHIRTRLRRSGYAVPF